MIRHFGRFADELAAPYEVLASSRVGEKSAVSGAQFEKQGIDVVAKAPPVGRRNVEFTLEDFKINSKQGVATCPAGKKSIRRDCVKNPDGWRYMFSRKDCNGCALRSKCTTARMTARTVTITEHTRELRRHRRYQRTKAFAKIYRRRVIVEHRIARLAQLGVRQARSFGRSRVAFQVSLAATVSNLLLAVSRALPTLQNGLRKRDSRLWRVLRSLMPLNSMSRAKARSVAVAGIARLAQDSDRLVQKGACTIGNCGDDAGLIPAQPAAHQAD